MWHAGAYFNFKCVCINCSIINSYKVNIQDCIKEVGHTIKVNQHQVVGLPDEVRELIRN